jgi:pyruvyltransferase
MLIKCFVHKNFGDEPLNRYLVEKITGKTPEILDLNIISDSPNYLISGSILGKSDTKSIVWGSGFITQGAVMLHPPARIYAVRGKLTWNQLRSKNITSPYIFGDPCLLLPKFFNPTVEKKYELGIIPHYTDQKSELLIQYRNNPNIKIIDICQNVEPLVSEVLQCKNIVSSSLHGLIVADTYKIKSLWINIGDKIQGVGYKYFDYYSITDRNPVMRFNLERGTDYTKLIKYCKKTHFTVDLEKFWEVCPLRRVNEK